MKSEERHKLKTNELAESIGELPALVRKEGKKWGTAIIIILVVLVGASVFRSSRVAAVDGRSARLQGLVSEAKGLQRQAVQAAQSGAVADLSIEGFEDSVMPVTNSLAGLAQKGAGDPVGKTALLQKAKLLRAQLFYAQSPLAAEKQQEVLSQVEAIYQDVLQNYSGDVMAAGAAQIGLGLVAEDRLQWDQAKETYQSIIDGAEGQWRGTIFPVQARQRIEAIDNLASKNEIVFEWVEELPAPVEASVEVPELSIEEPVVETESQPSSEEN